MQPTSQLAWELARATGFAAYLLLLVSVGVGLVLSLQWRSVRWPRFISTELHEFLTLLALLVIGAHTFAIALDPFMRFTTAELIIPFASHYRPVWMAWGILASYLIIAIWLSKRLRTKVGYGWWHRFHYLTFGAYLLATLHGLGMGSDSRTTWGGLIYAAGFLLVTSLLAARLLTPPPPQRPHPWLALLMGVVALWALHWAVAGPLHAGWNEIASNGHASRAGVALAAATRAAPNAMSSSSETLAVPFQAALQAHLTVRKLPLRNPPTRPALGACGVTPSPRSRCRRIPSRRHNPGLHDVQLWPDRLLTKLSLYWVGMSGRPAMPTLLVIGIKACPRGQTAARLSAGRSPRPSTQGGEIGDMGRTFAVTRS